MKFKMVVVGTVTYKNSSGKRLSIPHGECEIDETIEHIIIHWKNQFGENCQHDLSSEEYAQYKFNNALLFLQP